MTTSGVSATSGPYPANRYEYTSTRVKEEYERLLGIMERVMNKSVWTQEDYEEFQKAVDDLENLRANGIYEGPPHDRTYRLTEEMQAKANLVMNTLAAAGIVPGGSLSWDVAQQALETLKTTILPVPDGSEVTFSTILLYALGGLESVDKTLQGMLEADFVRSVNAQFNKKLLELEEQLRLTKAIADTLKALQDALNQVDLPPAEGYNVPPESMEDIPVALRNQIFPPDGQGKTWSDYVTWFNNSAHRDQYVDMSAEYFKNVIVPQPILENMPAVGEDMLRCREELRQQIEALKALGQDPTKAGTQANALSKVLERLDKALEAYDTKMETVKEIYPNYPDGVPQEVIDNLKEIATVCAGNFVLDGRTTVSGGNNANQNAISDAITSNQYLSDTVKDLFRQAMYVYETFQKLAMELMRSLSKSIEKHAQGLAR